MSFKINFLPLLILLLSSLSWSSQAQEMGASCDSSTFIETLKKGQFKGFSRTYFMSTINQAELKDFYNLGVSIGGHYESMPWRGFQIGTTGSFIFSLLGTDLSIADSITRQPNRYELGLFDVTAPDRRWDLGKLEEFYIKYSYKQWEAKLGRQLLNTPFINPQDGRLRPTFEEGVWVKGKIHPLLTIQGGYLWRISPRSTMGWYGIGESMGLYPVGRHSNGRPSGYGGQTYSPGIAILSLRFQKKNEDKGCELSVEAWEQAVLNVFNTAMLQADWTKKLNHKELKLHLGLQGTQQSPLGNGGNVQDSLRYFDLSQRSWILSSQVGISQKPWRINLNYTRIFDTGRFLMPREWGKEPFYTFIPRERNEGAGDVHTFSANFIYKIPKQGWNFLLSYGHNLLPDVKEAKLNKYALPAYGHAQLIIDKKFKGQFSGLDLKFIYMYKAALGETYDNPMFIYSKVNMHHINLIINYLF